MAFVIILSTLVISADGTDASSPRHGHLETIAVPLVHISSDTIAIELRTLFRTERIRILEDRESNTVVISGSGNVLGVAKAFIRKRDVERSWSVIHCPQATILVAKLQAAFAHERRILIELEGRGSMILVFGTADDTDRVRRLACQFSHRKH